MDSFTTIKAMERAAQSIKTGTNMKEIGNQGNSMDMVSSNGRMDSLTKDNMLKGRDMAQVNTHLKMEEYTKVTG